MAFTLHGIPVTNGIAIGKALRIAPSAMDVVHYLVDAGKEASEEKRLLDAFKTVRQELKTLRNGLPEAAPEEMAAFLDVHAMILADPTLTEKPLELIKSKRYNAEWALATQLEFLLNQFAEIEDEYLRERATDIRQVVERVMKVLHHGEDHQTISSFYKSVGETRELGELIVVAHDIAPPDMMLFKDMAFGGFVTDLGGRTSHTAIVARSLDIPAAVGVRQASDLIRQDDWLIIDGDRGIVIVDPSPLVLEEYRHLQTQRKLEKKKLQRLKYTPTFTLDGVAIDLMANVEMPEDAVSALDSGAVGIGLFRSEFLFMNRKGEMPDEEEQYLAYRRTAEAMKGLPVTIRTIDIGADKPLDAQDDGSVHVMSPLGLRAIRWSLSEPDMFLIQLRAILRASAFGQMKILIPMLAHVQEINQTLDLIELAKKQLEERCVAFDPNIKIGAMIEIPAAALVLPLFIRRLDFLSIGTNDLIQYTLAIDRADNAVAHLYDPLHPAVLRLIAGVIREANAANMPVSVCGEMAGEPSMTRVLLGMGLRDFSLHFNQLLSVKKEILRAHSENLVPAVDVLLAAIEPEEIAAAIEKINSL
ncbi:phosphoenolpyruvate--protein phosphotransferase [Polynucleobacter sp. MWH-Spelu-300-X4]|uniref:phosphoenolpyruvate--protein phosphotransferase n=1 Tax=Polynucleobacter sp. MWH-Spelu-300-X4 TaxID=2689109 RepID=UPI001BFE5A9E|nr:phosphoenolpyruvate--protein phosphotransferase [Polynucleobacter sp. MWH-Spelu-300-X4]QWD79676.1 phosphoenolpyruvate--protein phosphotransferase [Polynucleobacter sp. MWH-Spelu-300-X4]